MFALFKIDADSWIVRVCECVQACTYLLVWYLLLPCYDSLQTKELISEIESLEEEVANREQHVLSLYRTIFEQCVSRSTSEQSSCIASPAHSKNESKKHPSIISSAFCSSKSFPFRPFQALANINGSAKRNSMHSTTRQDSLYAGRPNTHFQHGSPRHGRVGIIFCEFPLTY